VNGLDDLGIVDALQIDGRDPEIAMAELALDDDRRHAFAGHLDGIGVAEVVWERSGEVRRRPRRCGASLRGRRRLTSGGRASGR
jgi:hypothetical protein